MTAASDPVAAVPYSVSLFVFYLESACRVRMAQIHTVLDCVEITKVSLQYFT
jgi:hypothetical protein